MHRILFVILAIFFKNQAFPVEKCDNLSHVRTHEKMIGEIVFTLDGCSGWSSVQHVDGKPVGEPHYVKFSEHSTVVDDENEAYEARHNWGWNDSANGYGLVLAHSFLYQGVNKKSGVKTTKLMIETFTRMGEFVHRGGAEVRTDIAPDGSETKTTLPFDDYFKAKESERP